jgi:hypothetical protein
MRSVLYMASAFLTIFVFNAANSQVSGCKDPAATNYNPSAVYNDGSCAYSTTSYTPPGKVDPISSTLMETSGLQMAGNFLWSFNDGGNAAAIYRLDTITGNILQTVNLQGAANVDWEDIGFDGTYFYVGDFGNNGTGIRTDLKIYKFPLSAIPDYITDPATTISSAQIEIINFSYSTQTDFTTSTSNNTKYDCEAMIVDGGQIHLFSKNWVEINTVHYIINSVAPGTYSATPVDTLATGYLVTGADKVPNQNIIALLGYQTSGFYNHFMHVLSDFSSGFYFNGNKRRINLPNVFTMGQAEGICFRTNSYGYISNEAVTAVSVSQKLRYFNLQSFVPTYVLLPADLLTFEAASTNSSNKISWMFTEPVKNLKLLGSENRIEFKPLYQYSSSVNGTVYQRPHSSLSCYKLEWQQADGSAKASKMICVNAKVENGITNLLLRRNGQLSFISTGSTSANYVFRLITTDGKLLALKPVNLISGSNKISFGNIPANEQLLILQISNYEKHESVLVKVLD